MVALAPGRAQSTEYSREGIVELDSLSVLQKLVGIRIEEVTKLSVDYRADDRDKIHIKESYDAISRSGGISVAGLLRTSKSFTLLFKNYL